MVRFGQWGALGHDTLPGRIPQDYLATHNLANFNRS
jgi:hypothetical protein